MNLCTQLILERSEEMPSYTTPLHVQLPQRSKAYRGRCSVCFRSDVSLPRKHTSKETGLYNCTRYQCHSITSMLCVQDSQEEGSIDPQLSAPQNKNKVLKMFKKPCWKDGKRMHGDDETPHLTGKHSKNSRSSDRCVRYCSDILQHQQHS